MIDGTASDRLIAAAFTPMRADGTLDLDRVGPMTNRLIREGVQRFRLWQHR